MKKIFLSLFALMAFAASTLAQFFDLATMPRIVQVQTNYCITQSAMTGLVYSNAPVDVSGFDGIGLLYISVGDQNTNVFDPSIAINVYQSDDQTTWTAIPNASLATSTVTTNLYGTIASTNRLLIFGAFRTATPSTDGFAGQTFTQEPFTNTLTFAANTRTNYSIAAALHMAELKKYMRLQYTVAGSNNAYMVNSLLIAQPKYRRVNVQ